MYSEKSSQGKKITIIVAVLLMVLFIWSVGFGIQRRSKSELAKQISFYQQRIDAKLNEASDLSTLNTERAQILVQEAKQDFQELKTKVGEKNYEQIASIEATIQKKEGEIFKREDKQPEEFYNLNLISDTAQGKKLFLEGDNLSILDTQSHQIYAVSVSKKSKESFNQPAIKNAKYISSYEGNEFILTSEGVYKITEDKQELVIKKDDDWGEITGIFIFHGNIYLLDSKKNNIYKYLVAEKGYSNKNPYFTSTEGIDLTQANSFAIDGSVYVAVADDAYKYTSGVAENFDVTLPNNQQLGIVKLFTDENTSKVYLLDKTGGKIYVVSKTGEYERQIETSILKKADDMVVSDEEQAILILAGNKIYKISLE